MELILITIIIVLLLAGLVVLYWRVARNVVDLAPLLNKLDTLRDFQERTDRSVRDEIARSRAETQMSSQQERTELAAALKVARVTAYQWVRRGVIPYLKLEGVVRFDPAEIDAWLKSKHRGARRAPGGEQAGAAT